MKLNHCFLFVILKAVNENLNFDEQILEAAKSVTNGAAALIKAATNAQKELVSQGKVSAIFNCFDSALFLKRILGSISQYIFLRVFK